MRPCVAWGEQTCPDCHTKARAKRARMAQTCRQSCCLGQNLDISEVRKEAYAQPKDRRQLRRVRTRVKRTHERARAARNRQSAAVAAPPYHHILYVSSSRKISGWCRKLSRKSHVFAARLEVNGLGPAYPSCNIRRKRPTCSRSSIATRGANPGARGRMHGIVRPCVSPSHIFIRLFVRTRKYKG
jgi:hypothetical protein